MVQESTMICVDNSEWMRNGDFTPTRLQSQQDAANLVLQCKLRANPENAVGLLSMADNVQVLATLTQESSKLFLKLCSVQPQGDSKFLSGIRIAHLALKHRQNRNHRMRIVLFIGSPMENVESGELTKLAKKLKKEKVQVDVVCFGETDTQNGELMNSFIDVLNGQDGTGSHLVVVPGGSTLTEALVASAVCRGEDGTGAPVIAATGGGGFEFGVDPADDPELAMALRVSLEEQRQRQQHMDTAVVANQETGAEAEASEALAGGGVEEIPMDLGALTEEQQLEWALRMSMQETASESTIPIAAAQSTRQREVTATSESDTAAAASTTSAEAMETDDDALGQLMNDPELLRQLVSDLPGVDPNSAVVRDAVERASEQSKDKDKKDTKKSGK